MECCGTLYEVPRRVGDLQAGTLLYTASFCVGSTASINVYSSSDEGRSWIYHSNPVMRDECTPGKGLWGPHFEVTADGALVVFWSDETDPCCGQKLAQIHSVTGTGWEDEKNTVASNIQCDRPGMAGLGRETPRRTVFHDL